MEFLNFDYELKTGKPVTHCGDLVVVQTRNPYGTHNLVVVQDAGLGIHQAIRHGNYNALRVSAAWMSERAYRKVIKHLVKKGWIT